MRSSYSMERCCTQVTNRTTCTRTHKHILTLLLSSHVGRGSDKHCLTGRACTISMISVCVTDMKRPDWGLSEPRFTSVHSSCPNTGNLVVEELVEGRHINVRWQRSFAPAKQFISSELTWLRLLSIDALRPECRLLLMQETDTLAVLGAVGKNSSRGGIWEKTSTMSNSLTIAVRHSSSNHNKEAQTR